MSQIKNNNDMCTASTISTGIVYHQAAAQIQWLCDVFGFERRTVIWGDENTIIHAHLTFGNGSIMISSAVIGLEPILCKSPKDVGGIGTVEIIVYVQEVDAHYHHAKGKGADIIVDIEDKPYGGRSYCCKDPEGHVWVFSSYNPWM